ncbi:TetR/AcrR family transcriptional regulator [Micromonospora sp. WMMD729]|uniref:TetR/AcrR family transcriptional regulator n=1 Tax=Micromonospora sp. WMMD729 TaxID=3404127 RepID=UPI003BF59D01
MGTGGTGGPTLRRDARENVAKLTHAAVQVFRAHGLGAPLEEVARTAGVSTGTLYNRFGTREALIDAVVPIIAAEQMATIATEARTISDPWRRFRFYLTSLLELQATLPALDDIMARRYPGSEQLARLCDEAVAYASSFLEAAQEDGSLRDDFGPADLVAIFLANSGILRSDLKADPDAWRRHVGFVLDGLRVAPRPRP